MKIGELATATATKVETVRYYEKIGLLRPPARDKCGTLGSARDEGTEDPRMAGRRIVDMVKDDITNPGRKRRGATWYKLADMLCFFK